MRNLGLTETHYYTQNRYTTRTYFAAQGTIFNIIITYNGKEYETIDVYMHINIHMYAYIYIYLNHFAVYQKPTQHYKSTRLDKIDF